MNPKIGALFYLSECVKVISLICLLVLGVHTECISDMMSVRSLILAAAIVPISYYILFPCVWCFFYEDNFIDYSEIMGEAAKLFMIVGMFWDLINTTLGIIGFFVVKDSYQLSIATDFNATGSVFLRETCPDATIAYYASGYLVFLGLRSMIVIIAWIFAKD